MAAFEYLGGLPTSVLTDRMKSVLLGVEDGALQWQAGFSDFVACLGVTPRVCKPYTPQTKGKVERTVGMLKSSFWPGVTFTDLDDLNAQALAWCDRLNRQPHTTTRVAPCVRLREEGLHPLPTDWAWERFATEERKVSWDGYVSYDGVLYGLPATAPGVAGGSPPRALAGTTVQVRERAGQVLIWSARQQVLVAAKHPQSRTLVPHPDQFRGVASAGWRRSSSTSLRRRRRSRRRGQRRSHDRSHEREVEPCL